MTNEEWKTAEERLSGIFGHVRLKIDGYNVTVEKRRLSEMRFCFVVFIDGKFQNQWTWEDCDIRRRFCHRSRRQLLSKKEMDIFKKKIGKKEFCRLEKEHPEKLYYIFYEPFFGSFRTLKSQLIKNNSSIELADDERL